MNRIDQLYVASTKRVVKPDWFPNCIKFMRAIEFLAMVERILYREVVWKLKGSKVYLLLYVVISSIFAPIISRENNNFLVTNQLSNNLLDCGKKQVEDLRSLKCKKNLIFVFVLPTFNHVLRQSRAGNGSSQNGKFCSFLPSLGFSKDQ